MTDLSALETPALAIDLDIVSANIALQQARADAAGVLLRPHAKTVKSPEIARMQIAAGAAGICCAKLSEAIVMVDGGITDVLVTTPVVGERKIGRLAELAARGRIGVVVDDAQNAAAIAAAARRTGAPLKLFVELDVGQRRTGVADPHGLASLARTVEGLEGVALGGMQAYNGAIQFIPAAEERAAAARAVAEAIAAARQACAAHGVALPLITGGGTGTAPFDLELRQIDELQSGSYIYMDGQYLGIEWPREAPPPRPALFVVATVVSKPAPDRAVVDVGWKAVSVDAGPPTVVSPADLSFAFAGDEHGIVTAAAGAVPLATGDTVVLRPAHVDTTINLYDRAHLLRDGRFDRTIEIAARGCTQ